jgi:hypothetical protein
MLMEFNASTIILDRCILFRSRGFQIENVSRGNFSKGVQRSTGSLTGRLQMFAVDDDIDFVLVVLLVLFVVLMFFTHIVSPFLPVA